MLFKAVYDPKAGLAGVYVARNAPGRRNWMLSLAGFAARYGINPFPEVPAAIAAATVELPRLIFYRYHRFD